MVFGITVPAATGAVPGDAGVEAVTVGNDRLAESRTDPGILNEENHGPEP